MSKITIVLLAPIIPAVLTACAGWGGSHEVVTSSPAVTSRSYSSNQEVVQYSDGTSVTNKATSVDVTWGVDHITKITTFSFADGTSNPIVSTVPGIVTSIIYSIDTESIVTTYGDGTISLVTHAGRSTLKSLPAVKFP